MQRLPAILCFPALGGAAACAAPPPPPAPGPDLALLFRSSAAAPSPLAAAPPQPAAPAARPAALPPCRADDDCGYDPVHRQCAADPSYNKQPPLTDQGLVCYCEAGACALLRVEPVPCEGEASCAVDPAPRPHPVRAGAEHPYRKPRPCPRPKRGEPARSELYTTCERTNICTMNRRECARP